jgi:hypothetical protein
MDAVRCDICLSNSQADSVIPFHTIRLWDSNPVDASINLRGHLLHMVHILRISAKCTGYSLITGGGVTYSTP